MSTNKYYSVSTVRIDMPIVELLDGKIKTLSFNDYRECLYEIYEKRGYKLAQQFIKMLWEFSLIDFGIRSNLNTFISELEIAKDVERKQKKLHNKILNQIGKK